MDIYLNGEIISDILAFEGFQRGYKTVDGENAGYALSGRTILDRIAEKNIFDFKCLPLTPARYNQLLLQLAPDLITVTLVDPDAGTQVLTMFVTAKPNAPYDKSTGRWKDPAFRLEEE